MSTSTSVSSKTPPIISRIKINSSNPHPPRMTGKHPPPGINSRPSASSSKTRPPPLPSPTTHASAGGGSAGSNANTGPGTRISERRRTAHKPGDFANPSKAKGRTGEDKSKVGLDGPELEGESIVVRGVAKKLQPRPFVKTTAYILKKFRNQPPSLVLHLHPQHFRFEGQDGHFGYGSPMKVILECLKHEIVPHEVVEEFREAGTKFYDGCLIVQIHDHRSSSTASSKKNIKNKNVPNSIHNQSEWLTPSPYVPYPKEKMASSQRVFETSHRGTRPQPETPKITNGNINAETPPKPGSKEPPKTKVFTTVLHPTPLTLHAEMAVLASTPMPVRSNFARAQSSSATSTPTSATMPVPPTPTGLTINTSAKNPTSPRPRPPKMILNDKTAPLFEAATLLNTSPALLLTPAKNAEHAQRILETLRDPLHSFPLPPPKSRKRTTAELAADEAQAAEEERLLLIMDERHSGSTSSQAMPESAVGDGSAHGGSFEPSFKKFKTLEGIRARLLEQNKAKTAEKQRIQTAEAERQRVLDIQRKREEDARRQQKSQAGSPTMQRQSSAQSPQAITATTRPGSSGRLAPTGAPPVPMNPSSHILGIRQQQLALQQQQQQQAAQQQQLQQGGHPQPQQHMQPHQSLPMSQAPSNPGQASHAQYNYTMQQQQNAQQQQRLAVAQSQATAAAARSPRPPQNHQSPPMAHQSPHLSQQSPHLAQNSPRIAQNSPRPHPQQQQQQQQQQQHVPSPRMQQQQQQQQHNNIHQNMHPQQQHMTPQQLQAYQQSPAARVAVAAKNAYASIASTRAGNPNAGRLQPGQQMQGPQDLQFALGGGMNGQHLQPTGRMMNGQMNGMNGLTPQQQQQMLMMQQQHIMNGAPQGMMNGQPMSQPSMERMMAMGAMGMMRGASTQGPQRPLGR